MRSSNSSPETSARDLASPTQDFASTAQNLASPARSPVEESFYESHIIQSRTAIENLYASNVLSCQKHTKEVKDLARQRKVKLLSFEREQRKFVKKMEELKLKQEAISSPQYSSPFDSGKAQEAAVKVTTRIEHIGIIDSTGAQKKTETVSTVRRSLPPLTDTNAAGDQSKQVKRLVRQGLPKGTSSKSCTELRSLGRKDNSRRSQSYVLLPAIRNGQIKSSHSSENVPDSPFVTHLSLKVPSDPHGTLVSRECQNAISMRNEPNWKEKELKSDVSTKVKWVPR